MASSSAEPVKMMHLRTGDVYYAPAAGMTFFVTDVREVSLFERTVIYHALFSSGGGAVLSGPHKATHFVDDNFLAAAHRLWRKGEAES